MKSRVHPKYKDKYRVANGVEYDDGLVQRGDVTVWLSPNAIAAWKPAPNGRRSGQREFSDLAIEAALTLRLAFHLSASPGRGLPELAPEADAPGPKRARSHDFVATQPGARCRASCCEGWRAERISVPSWRLGERPEAHYQVQLTRVAAAAAAAVLVLEAGEEGLEVLPDEGVERRGDRIVAQQLRALNVRRKLTEWFVSAPLHPGLDDRTATRFRARPRTWAWTLGYLLYLLGARSRFIRRWASRAPRDLFR